MELRRFEFAVDRLTIQPLEHAPATKLNVKLRLQLPDDIKKLAPACSADSTWKAGKFESFRAVPVKQGETELLPFKCNVQFNSSVMLLMEIIKAGAMLSIEAFHCAPRCPDQIIGRAHVPMQPLLSETWVQGRAPVWAKMQTTDSPPAPAEAVQVAIMGVRISLEDITSSTDASFGPSNLTPSSFDISSCHSPPSPPVVPAQLPPPPPPMPEAQDTSLSPPQARDWTHVSQAMTIKSQQQGADVGLSQQLSHGSAAAEHAGGAPPTAMRKSLAPPVDVVRISVSSSQAPAASPAPPSAATAHLPTPYQATPAQPQLPASSTSCLTHDRPTTSPSLNGAAGTFAGSTTPVSLAQPEPESQASPAEDQPHSISPGQPASPSCHAVAATAGYGPHEEPGGTADAQSSLPETSRPVRHHASPVCTTATRPDAHVTQLAPHADPRQPDPGVQAGQPQVFSSQGEMPSAQQLCGSPGAMDVPAAVAARAMHAMQPHPPAAAQPATPAHGSALPKVPQASPSVHRVSREASESLLGIGSHIPGRLPPQQAQALRHGAVDPGPPHAQHTADAAPLGSGNGQASAPFAQAESRQTHTAETGATAATRANPPSYSGASQRQAAPQAPGEAAPQAGGAVAVLSQLDLSDLFHAAEQQAAARLAASQAHEQSRQRSHEAAIARAEEAEAATEHAQQAAAFQRWRRRATLEARHAAVQQEGAAMLEHEVAWASREEARQRSVTEAAARVEALKGQVMQKAEDLEARQARLVAAEAAALRQRADLEHAHGRHVAEASAALGRLQAEFAHRLQLEERRAEEIGKQRDAAAAELEDAQAEAKRARAELQAAQAQPPPTPAEGLRAAAAAARRRAAEADARRLDAEASAAEFAAQLELMAVQLQQARDMQAAAREAVRRAALEPVHLQESARPGTGAAPAVEKVPAGAGDGEATLRQSDVPETTAARGTADAPTSGQAQPAAGAAAAKPAAPQAYGHEGDAPRGNSEGAGGAAVPSQAMGDATNAPDRPLRPAMPQSAEPEKVASDHDENSTAAAERTVAAREAPTQHHEALAEVKRLFQERAQLLNSGCYTMDDIVITQISNRISQLSQGL